MKNLAGWPVGRREPSKGPPHDRDDLLWDLLSGAAAAPLRPSEHPMNSGRQSKNPIVRSCCCLLVWSVSLRREGPRFSLGEVAFTDLRVLARLLCRHPSHLAAVAPKT